MIEWVTIKLTILIGLALAVLSAVDLWKKKLPAIIPTSLILLLLITRPNFILLGIIGFVYGLFLWEFNFFKGRADIKVIIIISLMLNGLNQFISFMTITALSGLIYKAGIKYIIKPKEETEIPFIPLLFIVYIIMMFLIHI